MSVAFSFPGQGSQAVGMLAELAQRFPEVEETFAEASRGLGYDLWELAQHGPEEVLNATEQTQPVMLTAGVAVWRVWRNQGGPPPQVMIGHSLGEYAALVCAGGLAFPDAVNLVAARGRFMQESVPQGEGAIAALIGLDDEAVETLCSSIPGEVWPVNFNAPGQVVIAGRVEAVESAMVQAQESGARRAIKLPMSVPVHCELMRPATARLQEKLEQTAFDVPRVTVLHNADNRSRDTVDGIRAALAEQLYSPVRWAALVRELHHRGVHTIVEPGPGRVLTGLARRVERGIKALAVYDPVSLDNALGEVNS